MTNEQLGMALLDVRKAYRLLYSYNRRVLDIAQTIDGVLDGDYVFWTYDTHPEPLKWNPSKWDRKQEAWGSLPFVHPCFYWKKSRDADSLDQESRIFVANFWSDSGYQHDSDNPEAWIKAEESRTYVDFWLARPSGTISMRKARNIFDDLPDETILKPTKSETGEFISIFDEIDMATLSVKSDVEAAVSEFLRRADSGLSRGS